MLNAFIFPVNNTFKKVFNYLLFFFFFLFFNPFTSSAQFPYDETFRNSTTKRADLVFGGVPSAFLTAGVLLRDERPRADAEGEGFLRLTNKVGDQKGYVYSNNVFLGTYGLDIEFEYFTYGGNGADGICFFLFDANVDPFVIGGYGGSLGYAQNTEVPGVKGGYMGIGLDEFGNFSENGQNRQGGPGQRPSSVTIRGAGNGGANNDANNYPFVVTKQTTTFTGNDNFNIAGGFRTAVNEGNNGYRKVLINLKPNPNGVGLLINLSILHNGRTTKIFEDEPYLTPIPPNGLKYGISASTGGSNNYHEIRGMKITVDPKAVLKPEALDDLFSICQGNNAVIDILKNDTRPNSDGAPNPYSVDLNPDLTGVQQDVFIPTQGRFVFDPVSEMLTFTPVPGFNTETSIKYNFLDIYGAPSSTATVTVTTVYPRIISEPVNTTVCEGKDAVFSIAIEEGTNAGIIKYQWQYFNGTDWIPLVDNANVTGSLTKEVTLINVPLTYNNRRYRAVVTSTNASCSANSTEAVLSVNPNVRMVLTSANQQQTRCINNSIQNISYAITNGTDAKVSGLPDGVTGAYNNGVFTISGTPAVSGIFDYTVTATGLCAPAIATGTITVNPDVTIVLNSANNVQTRCINNEIESINYLITYGTGATVTGLPNGVTGKYDDGTFIISGTPTAFGVFNYTITATGLCKPVTSSGTITVNPDVAIVLTSANQDQTRCINNAVQTISYTITNGTFATVSGLPDGVTGTYTNGAFTINGTPAVSGVFDYTVTATGLCKPAILTGTITVNPDVMIALNSANNIQVHCINNEIENINYVITNGTGATVTGLPNGVTGKYDDGTFIISGTPTAFGVFDYTVTATGLCKPVTSSGTITVNPDVTMVLTSANQDQTRCINNAVQTISYAITSGTYATVSGLPDGVTGTYTNGAFTISGTPAVSGIFDYTVTATGLCKPAILKGTITVNPDVTIVLNSANQEQIRCINNAIEDITYTITNGTGATVSGLPDGVTGSYINGALTISGTPGTFGVFDYTVTATGKCAAAIATGKITVNPDVAMVLTSANQDQTRCINNAVQTISYTITNGTDAKVTGLPDGVTGKYTNGAFTISGTPSVSGVFDYTVTATGLCKPAILTGTITVNPDVTIVLNSANQEQTHCINNAIQAINYTITNGTGATVTGLPDGVTWEYTNGFLVISGTPIVPGVFEYRVTATGKCAPAIATGKITVNPDVAIVLTSANQDQTRCINNAVQTISYTITNGTDAKVTGLPDGVTGKYTNGAFTITGTPIVSGVFDYTVTATGLCKPAILTGTITVNPDVSIVLNSANQEQTRCINTSIEDINYTIFNGTGAAVTGLPSGVTGVYSAGRFIISGTPTVAGIFNYTVTATGLCKPAIATGTITVNPDVAIVLTTANQEQTRCINTSIEDINYTISNGTDATVTGLPSGVTGVYTAGKFIISGTPTVSGIFDYTVTATGLCKPAIATGTITVNPDVTIVLNLANQEQTRCINTSIEDINYTIFNGTGAAVTGLPTGVTGVYSTGRFIISGTPTVAGIFNYTVTATGLCKSAVATGTITVNPDVAIVLTTANPEQTRCINTGIEDINYTISNGTGATVTGLPSGVTGVYTAGKFIISGTPTVSGVFDYTVTSTGLCKPAIATGTITVNPDVTIVLNLANQEQTRCINTSIEDINYTISNGTGAAVTGLPAGVTGVYSTGRFIISGTPTVSGIFDYTVTATGLCKPAFATGTITVNPDVAIVLTTANQEQTRCINTAIEDINYTISNGTGATVSGLPNGVTGVYTAGKFIISGTPTVSGIFDYTVTATGLCIPAITTGTITVNPDVVIVLTTANQEQTRCINTAIEDINYTITNGTGATVSGLPNGVTGTYTNGAFTISGIPTVAGVFDYTVTATGLCKSAIATGTITVNPDVAIILTTANQEQTRCINTSIEDINYTISNGTGATVTGLPSGVTGVYTAGKFIISGTPTVSGIFNYTVTATGLCKPAITTGTITVNPDVAIVLTTANQEQTRCINIIIEDINYTITNGTGATVSGLPNGVTGTYTNGAFTISGTPTVSGIFDYTVTATGLCKPAFATGTITVNPDVIIVLNSENQEQTRCINTVIEDINYTITNGTGATVSGLPNGVTGTYTNGAFTISGTPTVSGIFEYTVTATGSCAPAIAKGTITVSPNVTIAPTSAANIQTVCINTAVQSINYTITNGTGATVSGLPNGVTGTYTNGAFTISGTPTVSGIFEYTVTATGSCAPAIAKGTITVSPNVTIAPTSAANIQTVCINTAVQSINYTITNGTGATVSGLPNGVTGTYTNGAFTISGTPTVSGIFEYTVTATGSCAPAIAKGTITVSPDVTITLTSAADFQTVCINNTIQAITYAITNGTGATVSGLPGGLTGAYSNNTFTITGQPTQSGTFTYTVTATGNCQPAQHIRTITVNPNPLGFNDLINTLNCENSTISYSLQDNVNNTVKGGNAIPSSFTWTIVPNENIIGLTSGSGNTINSTLKNTSHDIQQAIYIVTPTSVPNGCSGETFKVTVNVPVCSSISIDKIANVSIVSQAGDQIKYTIIVKNTGAANHTNVVVNDPFLGGVLSGHSGDANSNGILEANESWIYSGTYIVTQADVDNNGKPTAGTGTIINTATLKTAEHPNLLSALSTVTIKSTGNITLVKTGVMSSDFSTITYTFKITNTGNVRLSDLSLTDPKIIGEIVLGSTILEVGASTYATATYAITDNEKRDGRVQNTATVNGNAPGGDLVKDISGTQDNNDDPTLHIIDDSPQAINDRAETIINQPVTFSITQNDLPSFNGLDAGSVIITRYPVNGTLSVSLNGTVTYTPNRGFSGQDDFMYTVTDYKGKISNKGLVNITVTPIALFIPNTFTPNGDGKNDTFKIVGRESFDTLELLIFNRWGNEVYRNKNYQDEWDGSGLSEGTYYYVLSLKKGADQVTKKGWILLKR